MSQLASESRIEELRRRVREEIERGDLDRAIALCDEAGTLARELDDQELRDLAICNRGSILVNRGEGGRVVGELRRVLLRSASAESSFVAAYALSQFHEQRREGERGLFYARLALDHAKKSREPTFISWGNNRIANLLMLDSYFAEAADHYQRALDELPRGHDLDRALVLSNLGYCRAVLGSYNQGLKCLFRSLEIIRRSCVETWERFPCLGLSYAYLEIGRLDQARRYGCRALHQSQAAESAEQIKNSLYLLGEAEKLAGNEWAAYEYFARLQTEFYPDQPYLGDFLMATDIRKLINLMA